MAILTPDEIASLAPGSPLLGAPSLGVILQQAQLLAESPEAASRPLEFQEFRDTFTASRDGIVTPHYFPISRSRSPRLEYDANPCRGRLQLPQWTVTDQWQLTRRGEITVSYPNHARMRNVRLAYVAGFNFLEPEAGTEDWVREIKMQTLAIAEQLYIDAESLATGDRFSAEAQIVIRMAAAAIGPASRSGDRAKINLRKFRPGYGPIS